MNRGIVIITALFVAQSLFAQGLKVNQSVQMKVGSSASLQVGSDLVNQGQIYNEGLVVVDGTITNSNRLNMSNNASSVATLDVNGDINNTGNLENVGLILLSGNWMNTGTYNGIDGQIEFDGTSDQEFTNSIVDLNNLTVNSGGTTFLRGDTVRILGVIDFVNGYINTDAGTFLIVEDGAEVLGGSDNSYSLGKLHQRGVGYKFYPVGNNNLYLPVYFEQIFGQEPLMGVRVEQFSNPPIPDRLLVGISESYYWNIETVWGRFDSSKVTVDYVEADLESSAVRNNIAYESATPALAESESLDAPFTNLFTTDPSIEDPGLFSSGVLTGERSFTKRYLAIALSPKIPEAGVSYIPNTFAPSSTNDEDRVLKFYGEKVLADGFSFKVYDRHGKLMFQANDINHAKTLGWDGLMPNGNPAPGGYYFYSAKYQFENGRRVSTTGEIMLIR